MDSSISLSDLKVEWIYYLYEDMVGYIAENDFQREEESSVGISLSLGTIYFEEDLIQYTPPQLRGSATGVRENLFTRIDLTASKYKMIEE